MAFSQDTLYQNSRDISIHIFIDCSWCDMDYIRREIPYVNYVRDISDADVYIREIRQVSGSGGREYTYFFIGQKDFKGLNDTLVYSSFPDDTDEMRRAGRTKMINMGLMRYIARTPLYKEVTIRHSGNRESEPVPDKWNNWVFEIQTRPRFETEESYKEFGFSNSIEIFKITPQWKIEFEFDHRLTRTKYTYEEDTYVKEKSRLELENLIVKSLGSHWSAGGRIDLLTSSFSNINFRADIFPSVEYNLFPYSESNHRQLRILYGIGISMNQYLDTTIYGKTDENLAEQQLKIAYRVQDRWGSINISLESSNYLHDFSKNRTEIGGNLDIRVFRGLYFGLYGQVARIHDQLSLVKGELSEADILLQLQELATSYNAYGGIRLTYTFGSIFNNVVNPRFGNGR